MSRQITIQGLARAVRYLERAFLRYGDEAMAEAFKTAGIDDETVGFVGEALDGISQMKLLPERPERNCVVCGDVTGSGPLDEVNPRANAVYCSNACRQKAYRKRKADRYGQKARRERPSVTKSESVTEALLGAAAQP
jgi:hypothetical protein